MATLTAIKFDTPDGADQLEAVLQDLQRQQLITVLDAAVVSWPAVWFPSDSKVVAHRDVGTMEPSAWKAARPRRRAATGASAAR